MTDERPRAWIVHGIGQIPHQDHLETEMCHLPDSEGAVKDTDVCVGCVANTVIQTGQRQCVLFGSLYLRAFQRCRTGCNQFENRICNTSAYLALTAKEQPPLNASSAAKHRREEQAYSER
jgi:hypothetical protein